MIAKRRPKIFYGWYMVWAAFCIQFLTSGLLNQSYGAYVAVLRDQFGWSKTSLSGAYSMQQLQMGLMGPAQGMIISKFGTRNMMRVGIVILGAGFVLLAQIHSLTAFYAAFFLMSVGSSLSGFFPLTVAIINWFERRRAKAISTTAIGFAMGGVVVPIVAFCLEHFGWRQTATASGILIVLLGLPLIQVIRSRPEDYGEVVDGIREPEPGEPVPAGHVAPRLSRRSRDFTFHEAVRTRAFWLLNFGHGSALLIVSAVNVFVISHLESIGYSLGTASLIVTFMTSMQIVGMIIGGVLGDRTDGSVIATACMAMHMVGLLLVAYAVNFPMVVAFSILHGIAWGLRGPLMQAIRADYFGRTNFATIMGFSSMVIMFGTVGGPLVAGALADLTGSYKAGFTVLAILAGLGSIFFILAKPPQLPEDAAGSPAREPVAVNE